MRPLSGRCVALLVAFAVAPVTAHAHLVSTRFGDYYAGLIHPLTGFETALPWLALGLLAGLHAERCSRWLLIVFPAAVCIGAALSRLMPGIPLMSEINLLSLIVLGGLAAIARTFSTTALLAFAVLFGLSHGYVNGLALAPGGSLLLFIFGVTTAGYLTIALTTAGTTAFVQNHVWGAIAVRATGSWVAAIGIIMTGIAFAPK